MKQSNTKRNFYISLGLNLVIVIMEIAGLIMSMNRNHSSSLKYYTEESNIFALITSCIFCVASFCVIKSAKFELPKWVQLLKYLSTCCLTVTLIVVITILAPMGGKGSLKNLMLYDSLIFHHFLCPVVALISFIFFETGMKFNIKTTLIALSPTVLYAIVTVILNIAKLLVGPYDFLKVYEQTPLMSVIWFIVICGGAWVFALVILKLNSLKNSSKNN